jgi:hypothetical protein
MSKAAFGNEKVKIRKYIEFWNRDAAVRPLVGFTFVGWFPLNEFAACRSWNSNKYLTPEMMDPQAFLEDYSRILKEGEKVSDDLIRGACPMQVAVPFLPAMLGCPLRVLPENVMGEELLLPWDQALKVRLDRNDPWFAKYIEFANALVAESNGRFPVSHSPEIGPTDLHAVLRGHNQSILDLMEEPEKSADLLWQMGKIFLEITQELWSHVPLFHGGYFDAQYSLWSPGPIIRVQEDATAVYSPKLYRKLVQPIDRMLASHFASSFIHLHSTSMFLLDAFLEIQEIRCFEINNDVCGPPLEKMVPYFTMVQEAKRPLLIRGSFTPDEIRLLMDSLESRGLFLNIMVNTMEEIEILRPLLGM